VWVVVVSDEVQPGVRIDSGIWQRFREDINARKGSVRGHLRTELEAAIQQYLDDHSDPTLERIEAKMDYLAAELDADISDAPTPSTSDNTHTREQPTPDEKPAPNAATEKKVRWLAAELLDKEVPNTRELQQVARSSLVDLVKDRYGFRSDTAKRYVDELIEHFGLRDHPIAGSDVLVSQAEYERIVEQQRQEREQEAEETL
jgi:hypothetical protein